MHTCKIAHPPDSVGAKKWASKPENGRENAAELFDCLPVPLQHREGRVSHDPGWYIDRCVVCGLLQNRHESRRADNHDSPVVIQRQEQHLRFSLELFRRPRFQVGVRVQGGEMGIFIPLVFEQVQVFQRFRRQLSRRKLCV